MNVLRFLNLFLIFILTTGCVSLPLTKPVHTPTDLPLVTNIPARPEAIGSTASAQDTEQNNTDLPKAAPTESPAASPAPSTGMADYLVLISLDACRPEYLELAELPNLQSLIQSGVSYSGAWVGSFQNNTPPGHTEMSTGTFPKTNGILGFAWGNQQTGIVNPTTLEAINAGEMAQIVKDSGVPTLAGLVKQKYPDAVVAALSAHKYYAAQGLGVGPTDYILYAEAAKGKRQLADTADAQPGYEPPRKGTIFPAAIQGHTAPDDFMKDPALRMQTIAPGDSNRFVIKMGIALLNRYQPRALLLNLPETDAWGHRTGGLSDPDAMRAVMIATDQAIGELMDAYHAAGIFDRTLWVVTGDHGMTAGEQVYLNADVREQIKLSGKRSRVGVPLTVLNESTDSAQIAQQIEKAALPGVVGVYVRSEDGASYQPALQTKKKLPEALNDAYVYLLDTYATPFSAHIVMTTEEGVHYEGNKKDRKGGHGEINWANQHIPLILSGPGVKKGSISTSPARLVDLAPTISRLMGFSTRGMDGAVLSDALAKADQEDVQAQEQLINWLAPLRDALEKHAHKNR
jgi:arylsulfatase A-like enzyme